MVGCWLVVLRINVNLAIFQPYLDLEAGDNLSLKIQVARPYMFNASDRHLYSVFNVREWVILKKIKRSLTKISLQYIFSL